MRKGRRRRVPVVGRTRPIAVLSRRLAFFFHSRRHPDTWQYIFSHGLEGNNGGGLETGKDRPENLPDSHLSFINVRVRRDSIPPAACGLKIAQASSSFKLQVDLWPSALLK